jgi:hypothetical protein
MKINSHDKHDSIYHTETTRTKFLKLWLWGIALVSIFILIIQVIYNNDVSGPSTYKCNYIKEWKNYVRSKTPGHPRPLLNFME